MVEIRTERTYGVTRKLDANEVHILAEIARHPGWPVLLDVMEMAVIEQESRLINRDVSEPAAILAEHSKAQMAWQIFTSLQERVLLAARIDLERRAKPLPDEALSPDELDDEELLNPLHHNFMDHP